MYRNSTSGRFKIIKTNKLKKINKHDWKNMETETLEISIKTGT